jgi:hypothetical protein
MSGQVDLHSLTNFRSLQSVSLPLILVLHIHLFFPVPHAYSRLAIDSEPTGWASGLGQQVWVQIRRASEPSLSS